MGNVTKEIGGFFELGLPKGSEYHKGALQLNSARNCFKYILQTKKPSKVWLPAYCCDSLIEPLKAENIAYDFYFINKDFEPLSLPELKDNEYYLYINYYGLKSKYVRFLKGKYSDKLIIDNTQAFFDKPIDGVDTFYSARKFFGVADGGYLYTNKFISKSVEKDISFDRMKHILGRYEIGASELYNEYRKSEASLMSQPIKEMSKLTSALMSSLDYKFISDVRKSNFDYLSSELDKYNLLSVRRDNTETPMIYPLLIDADIKNELIKNKIYIATYWNDCLKRISEAQTEWLLVKKLIPIPIDQRYSKEDMERVISVIVGCLG